MLVLFETPAGYAVFKLLDESKLKKLDNIWDEFGTPSKAQEILRLVEWKEFKDVDDALSSVVSQQEGKLGKTLKKVLKKQADGQEQLAVADMKLGSLIKEKLDMNCVTSPAIAEVMRAIRANLDELLGEHKEEIDVMRLALAHSLGRYKVKFNPEKLDTMIVQAVSLLDDLDKELNNYAMRLREWYGWHFPELTKLIQDHQTYAKIVKTVGLKQNAVKADLSAILPEELAQSVKNEAEISMGTDISELDLLLMNQLCSEIIEMAEYRGQLHDYLKNRMVALAPNLTILLGELIGARLISKAGSLMQLAKHPASTVQILGAEKALFRALKTKKDTPKYGIIYHAQLITQAGGRLKGKMARKLAAKVSLATRYDALNEDPSASSDLGIESRAYLEAEAKREMERPTTRVSGIGRQAPKAAYPFKRDVKQYDPSADSSFKRGVQKRFPDEGAAPDSGKRFKGGAAGEDTAAAGTPSTSAAESGKKQKKQRKSKASESGGDEMEE